MEVRAACLKVVLKVLALSIDQNNSIAWIGEEIKNTCLAYFESEVKAKQFNLINKLVNSEGIDAIMIKSSIKYILTESVKISQENKELNKFHIDTYTAVMNLICSSGFFQN